jgi:hypothetical protein
MPSCNTSNNPLDPVGFNYDRDVNIQAGSTCDQDSLSCSDIINLCLCDIPEIEPPVPPEDARCVNDIIKRPWPPPPPANPGCNPVSINVTNRQDTSVAPSENIRLQGTVGYVGEDPCLPEINLELITNPDFRSGGANPIARGWGVGMYGIPNNPTSIDRIRILPAEECPDSEFNTPQDFLAEEPGAEHFLPDSDLNCTTTLDVCEYRQAWALKVAHWGLIGPRLMEVDSYGISGQIEITVIENGQPKTETVDYAWSYKLVPANCIKSGNTCLEDACRGYPFGPYYQNQTENILLGMEDFDAVYNIKENLGSGNIPMLSPGVNLQFAVQSGLRPQPIQKGTQVLMYGWVPWTRGDGAGNNAYDAEQCSCKIQWFIDVPNALAGQCRTDDNPEGLTSMIPTRTVNSAGMFFGGAVDGARV